MKPGHTPQKIWTETYKISSYLLNLRGQAGLYAILNLIQDVGWMHAFHMDVKLEPHLGWVFTRQKLVMTKWPAWNETVTIRTWLRPPERAFLFRDYEILVGDQKIGEATASFLVMDLRSRKAVQIDWNHIEEFWRNEAPLSLHPEKISVDKNDENQGEELARFRVRNSDIDMNNHVNNTKYSQWVLDSLPIDVLRKGPRLQGYEVNFLSEAKLGDEILIRRFQSGSSENGHDTDVFVGVRARDEKNIFTAKLLSLPKSSHS